MKICVVYIAVANGPMTTQYCARFATTWNQFPPGVETDLLVVVNGGALTTEQTVLFASLKARMLPRQNDGGWDVTGYLDTAKGPCAGHDAMLCLGESNYFHRAGWLKRLAEAWEKHGPGMYGPYASNLLRPHLNTTAFFVPPALLKSYPLKVFDLKSRYHFEHGPRSLWRLLYQGGTPVFMVTWDGEWKPPLWRNPPNILWRGDQSNCLMWCNHTDRWANSPPETQLRWSKRADAPFQ